MTEKQNEKKLPNVTYFTMPSKTEDHHRPSCCPMNIIRKHGGIPPSTRQMQYGDFSEITGYDEALSKIYEVDDKFSQLPDTIKSRFNYNPSNMFEFLMDEQNYDEALDLGLIQPKESTNENYQESNGTQGVNSNNVDQDNNIDS
jgi:phage internal scaffolding protein